MVSNMILCQFLTSVIKNDNFLAIGDDNEETEGRKLERGAEANHLMKLMGFDYVNKRYKVSQSLMRRMNLGALENILSVKFKNKRLLAEAMTHASKSSSRFPCYERLEFLGDAVLGFLITIHLFLTYTDLRPSCLTNLRAAAVNNNYFARVTVKHNLHLHLHHGSSALEARPKPCFFFFFEFQISDYIKNIEGELSNPGHNSSGLGKAPKVLADILESIAGAIFLDNGGDLAPVWKVSFNPSSNLIIINPSNS
ncbi:endoribonuclease Dicer homolog 1-like [Wolffia australiana]